MGQQSSIDRLPKDVREKLHEFLNDRSVTQIKATELVNALLEERGEYTLSKSAVNRYAMSMEKVGAKLRESREVAELWIGKLGSQPAGEVGKLLNEILRTLAFEMTMPMLEGEEKATPKMINQLALAVMRLEKAAKDNDQTARKIQQETREENAEVVEKIASKNGLSKKAIEEIKKGILGVD